MPESEPGRALDLAAEIRRTEHDLAELRSRLPAHSLKVAMARELDELEDRLGRLRAERAALIRLSEEGEAAMESDKSAVAPMAEMTYQVTSDKPFDEAVEAVKTRTAEKGFRVLHVHDVQATLAEKGFKQGPMKIIEVCNAKYANSVIQADPAISLFMPCKINVYRDEQGRTVLNALRPSTMATFFPGASLGTVPDDVDSIVRSIVDGAR
ncbi:MAG TPA: DUF302 domain-containing protein [Bacillota bacterium]|jgi:uncharacterized protein (DUF302 family)